MKHIVRIATLSILSLTWCWQASADVVNNPDVGGLRTFRDTNTGRVWVDMDNFFEATYFDMKSAVEAAGFVVATRGDIDGLLGSLTLLPSPDKWDGYALVMGRAPNRELIWGAYVPEFSSQSWAWSSRGDTSWNIVADSGFPLGDIPNSGGDSADMNIWAFQGGVIPEPSSFGLLGVAAISLMFGTRRRRK